MSLYIRNYETFINISDGKKKIEIRLAYGFNLTIKPGDKLSLQYRKIKIPIIITDVSYYKLFDNLYNNIRISHVFPDIAEINYEKARNKFHSYYSPDKLDRYPIVALHLQVI